MARADRFLMRAAGCLAAAVALLLGAGCAREGEGEGSGARNTQGAQPPKQGPDNVLVRSAHFEALRDPNCMTLTYGGRSEAPGRLTFSPMRGSDASPRPAVLLPAGGALEIRLPNWLPEQPTLELKVAKYLDSVPEGAELPERFDVRLGTVIMARGVGSGTERPLFETDPTGGWETFNLSVKADAVVTLRLEAPDAPPGFAIALSELLVTTRASVPVQTSSPEAPNLVFVVLDTLRMDRTSLADPTLGTTPVLSDLATNGTTFDRAFSTSPWTWPSTASLLTGKLPPAHGVLDRFSCFLSEDLDTLPELAQRAGLRTAGYSTNPLIADHSGFAQGLESLETRAWERAAGALDFTEQYLQQTGDRRFLLYLHLTEPHSPYVPEADLRERFCGPAPEGYSEDALRSRLQSAWRTEAQRGLEFDAWLQHTRDLYDAEVAAADRALERLVELLKRAGLTERTVLVVTSDHGEELLEHGRFGHAEQLFAESVHVPLVLHGPGVPAGQRSAFPVQNHLLMPTLAGLMNFEFPSSDPDLLALAQNPPAEPRPLLLSTDTGFWLGESDLRRLEAVRLGDEHSIYARPVGGLPARLALYDTESDPLERNDLRDSRLERARSLRDLGRELWDAAAVDAPTTVDGSEAVGDLLEALGYRGDR